MLKSIAKIICPSSAKIAESAANSIQVGYNGVSPDKREKLARYSALARKIGEQQAKLDELIADGKIDDEERDRIAAALEPMVDAAKSIVFN